MGRYELWIGEGESSFFREDNEMARREAQSAGLQFVWAVDAKGYNAAMQAMHQYRGWGDYQPDLDETGKHIPEHEDDDHSGS